MSYTADKKMKDDLVELIRTHRDNSDDKVVSSIKLQWGKDFDLLGFTIRYKLNKKKSTLKR
jgi:hypothetical protein